MNQANLSDKILDINNKQIYLLRQESASKQLLLFFEEIIDSGDITETKTSDILEVFFSALNSHNSIEINEKILDLHTKLVSSYELAESINDDFFRNIKQMFKIKASSRSANFDRKLNLLLEFYVIKCNENFSLQHYELILEFLESRLKQSFSFPFVFIVIKIVELVKKETIKSKQINELINSIKKIVLELPDVNPDMEKLKKQLQLI
jgi:hypothetical protein